MVKEAASGETNLFICSELKTFSLFLIPQEPPGAAAWTVTALFESYSLSPLFFFNLTLLFLNTFSLFVCFPFTLCFSA